MRREYKTMDPKRRDRKRSESQGQPEEPLERKVSVLSTHFEDIREESGADPLTGEVIEACETGEGTDEGSVGRGPHPAHLENTGTDSFQHVNIVSHGNRTNLVEKKHGL